MDGDWEVAPVGWRLGSRPCGLSMPQRTVPHSCAESAVTEFNGLFLKREKGLGGEKGTVRRELDSRAGGAEHDKDT